MCMCVRACVHVCVVCCVLCVVCVCACMCVLCVVCCVLCVCVSACVRACVCVLTLLVCGHGNDMREDEVLWCASVTAQLAGGSWGRQGLQDRPLVC